MANVQVPGFIPLRSTIAGATIANKRHRVLTNNTTAIAKGDAVIIDANGAVLVASTATAAVASVAQGASYIDSDGTRVERHHLPAATLYTSSGVNPSNASYVYIVDDGYNTVYEASVDEAIALTDLGLNYKMVLGTLTTNGYSGHELDATSRAVTATGLPWRVHNFIDRPGHDPDAADAHVECRINLGLIEPALSAEEGE